MLQLFLHLDEQFGALLDELVLEYQLLLLLEQLLKLHDPLIE
jgi:hypothetical protein